MQCCSRIGATLRAKSTGCPIASAAHTRVAHSVRAARPINNEIRLFILVLTLTGYERGVAFAKGLFAVAPKTANQAFTALFRWTTNSLAPMPDAVGLTPTEKTDRNRGGAAGSNGQPAGPPCSIIGTSYDTKAIAPSSRSLS